jgi:hypothetical protein
MNVLRRIAMAIGGTVVIALVIGLAAPKTVHAVVSALVTVANTSANPVPVQSVDNPARQAFQTLFGLFAGGGQMQGEFFVPNTTTTGAPVKELVIEEVSGFCTSGGPGEVVLSTNGGIPFTFLGVADGAGFSLSAQSVRFYADAGTPVSVGTGGVRTGCQISISGYLVTQ